MSSTPDKYVVFGYPIKHSLSPAIHTLFAEHTEQHIEYDKVQVEGSFYDALRRFIDSGGKGANVTSPFKEDAFAIASELSIRAKTAGAVNTLIFENGRVKGDNTDGIGLVHDLVSQIGSISGLKILIIGAGGAARGVVNPLFDAQVTKIHLANRTPSKAEELTDIFSQYGDIQGGALNEIPLDEQFDIVINSTSSSVLGECPDINPSVFQHAKLVYDMYYHKEDTVFMEFAKSHAPNVQVSDGLGMLIGQAAESFYLWRGVRPELKPVVAKIKAQLV